MCSCFASRRSGRFGCASLALFGLILTSATSGRSIDGPLSPEESMKITNPATLEIVKEVWSPREDFDFNGKF